MSRELLAGRAISIDLRYGSYFGIGSIWLTPTRYWCVIPADLDEGDYQIILYALHRGSIVRGKLFIPPVERQPGVPDEYFERLQEEGLTSEVALAFYDLIMSGRDRGWTAIEVLKHCDDRVHKTGLRNAQVRKFLHEEITLYRGPMVTYEEPTEEQGLILKKVAQ